VTESERYMPLPGSERHALPGSRAIGFADPNQWLEVSVRVRHKAGLPSVDDPGEYEHIGYDEFTDRYGADEHDFSKVESFAANNGLSVTEKNAATRIITLTGTVAAFSAAFDVKLMRYAYTGGTYRGRQGPLHIPDELQGIVTGVFGLDNRPQARSHSRVEPLPVPTFAVAPTRPWFFPPELAEVYNFPDGNGDGQCVGILEFGGGFDTDDLSTYFDRVGVPLPEVLEMPVDTKNEPGVNPDEDGEVMLDIEVVGALAPKAKIAVYFSRFTERGWVDAISSAVHDQTNRPSVLSISWGFAEGQLIWTQQAIQAVNESLQEAALLGVTVCAATGDDGSSDQVGDGHAHADFPASSPYVLGVGGTTLRASGGSITKETVWNGGPRATAGGAGGGGISSTNAVPPWQKDVVPPSVNPGHRSGRGIPDVAAVADQNTGYFVRSGGQWGIAGGTSASAPLWAALIAIINQQKGHAVGYLNPLLYKTLTAAGICRDITEGNNDTEGLVGGYSAGQGWDACTGWGTPDGKKMLSALP
jgi:kumamolisin